MISVKIKDGPVEYPAVINEDCITFARPVLLANNTTDPTNTMVQLIAGEWLRITEPYDEFIKRV